MPNDTVRASATAVPNSSRRAALGLFASASTAMLAFAAGAPAAAAAAGEDAKLFDLIRIWGEKAALTTAASRLHDETDEQEYRVPRPTALLQSDEDVALGLSEPRDVGTVFCLGDVERIRHGPLLR